MAAMAVFNLSLPKNRPFQEPQTKSFDLAAWLQVSPTAGSWFRIRLQHPRYTGGTIGMMKGPDGSLRPEPGKLKERLQHLEELNQEKWYPLDTETSWIPMEGNGWQW